MSQYFAYPQTLAQDSSSKQKLNVQLSKRLNMGVRQRTIPMLKIITHQHLPQFPMAFLIHYVNSSKRSISTPIRMLTARRSVHHQH
jgi:hypothetical protein